MKFREMTRRLGIAFLVGATARKRIGKTGTPSAEHLPKGTAPYVDAIIGARAKNPDGGRSRRRVKFPSPADNHVALKSSFPGPPRTTAKRW